MRIHRSLSVPAAPVLTLSLAFFVPLALAQEPTPPTPTPPAGAPETPTATPAATPAEAPPEADTPRRPRRPRTPSIVLEAGTVHPVSGPAIQDGVVVIRGERIVAVGKKGEIEVPPNATVRSFPTGHAYPGLVDAQTDAFADDNLRNDGDSDGSTQFADDLRRRFDRSDELVQAGITTAYVTVRSPSFVRGQGAIVRPTKDGFELWSSKEHAALQLRMTNGLGPSHALQRQQQLAAADGLFEGLDEFRKAKTDHDEALKKYEKEFADYLAFHQKKKDGDKKDEKKPEAKPGDGAPAADKPPTPPAGAGEGPPPGGGEGRRRRGGPPREEPPKAPGETTPAGAGASAELEAAFAQLLALAMQEPVMQDPPKQDPPKQEPKPAGAGDAPAGGQTPAAEKKDEGPKRPTYPKAPPKDPQKDALLQVLDGELPLRIEAHRADELRAALKLQRDREIPVLVLEQAYGASAVTDQLATQGVAVVLTEVLPIVFAPPYDVFEPAALPQRLQAAGVPFAIASGNARVAAVLPLQAATAVGHGLDAEAALRAITLTPAEILGVAKDTGSLQANKFADVLVTDRPLLQTDSRVLLVLQKGRTEFEAK